MAGDIDPEVITRIKRMIGSTSLSDPVIGQIYVDEGESVNCAVAAIWAEKAASSSDLMDITEGSSTRKLSQLAPLASAQAKLFAELCAAERASSVRTGPTTRPIERP